VRAAAIALILAFATATTTNAYADDREQELAEAKRLESALEYDKALVIVERVIASGGATREQLVELHVLAGKLAAGLDREQIAEDHFARALALAPATTLPDGTSPKITRPFDSARAHTVPLRVSAGVERGIAMINVEGDALKLVAGLVVKIAGAAELREPQGRRIELPDRARATEVIAIDAYGNQVWSQRVVESTAPPPPPPPPGRPIYKSPWLWGSLFVVTAGVGAVGAWQLTKAQNEWNDLNDGTHDYSELLAIEQRGKRWGVAANIGFGLAAATGLVTAWFIVTGRSSSSTTAAVVATGDGLGVAINGRF